MGSTLACADVGRHQQIFTNAAQSDKCPTTYQAVARYAAFAMKIVYAKTGLPVWARCLTSAEAVACERLAEAGVQRWVSTMLDLADQSVIEPLRHNR